MTELMQPHMIRTTKAMWAAVEALAERNGRPAAEEVRIAIEERLARAANVHLDEPVRRPGRRARA